MGEKADKRKHIDRLLHLALKVHSRFPRFYLAGGTALMFKHQHRTSIDLDFFHWNFSPTKMASRVKVLNPQEVWIEGDSVNAIVESTKISLVLFPFKNIKPLEHWKGIPLASDLDIFLNKLYAAGRRIEWKDAYDIAFLYRKYRWDLSFLKEKFERKFPGQNFLIFAGAAVSLEDYPELPSWCKEELTELSQALNTLLKNLSL